MYVYDYICVYSTCICIYIYICPFYISLYLSMYLPMYLYVLWSQERDVVNRNLLGLGVDGKRELGEKR